MGLTFEKKIQHRIFDTMVNGTQIFCQIACELNCKEIRSVFKKATKKLSRICNLNLTKVILAENWDQLLGNGLAEM